MTMMYSKAISFLKKSNYIQLYIRDHSCDLRNSYSQTPGIYGVSLPLSLWKYIRNMAEPTWKISKQQRIAFKQKMTLKKFTEFLVKSVFSVDFDHFEMQHSDNKCMDQKFKISCTLYLNTLLYGCILLHNYICSKDGSTYNRTESFCG